MTPKRNREDELGEEQSDWRNLPTDILIDIYQRLDDKSENKLELRRIRSVCNSWRSSLSPLTPTTPKFPLILPHPSFINSTDDEPSATASLSQSDLFLFPPPPGFDESAWIVKVEQRVESSKWRLENPFLLMSASFEHSDLFRGSFDIFDCNVKEIARSYMLEYSSSSCDKKPKQAKAVISWNSKDKCVDFTVLVLFGGGKLGLWRPGEDAGWSVVPSPFTEILIFEGGPSDSNFSDIITFESKFYAVTMEGRLMMINPTTYEDSEICYGREKVSQFAKIFWPPPDWLLQQHFKYCPH